MATNIPFLQAVLDDPDFRTGRVTTSFIEQRPGLLSARSSADRGTKLLTYLADVTVNKPHGERPRLVEPLEKLPAVNLRPAARRVPATAAGARPTSPRTFARGPALTDRPFPRRAPVAAQPPACNDLITVTGVYAHH